MPAHAAILSSAPPADAAPAPSAAELRVVRRELTTASDHQLRRVIALVDAMSLRGMADVLIDPLRQRLGRLRPARQLRFERLLFMPLDPLIVQPRDWRPTEPTIPRTAVLPLARTVRIALGRETGPIETLIEGRTAQDRDIVDQAGALLWPDAARILAIAPCPPDWAETALPAANYKPIATAVAAVLARQAALETLIRNAETGLFGNAEADIEELLADMAGVSVEGQSMVVALLLARLPDAAPLLSVLESARRIGGVAQGLASDSATGAPADPTALRRAADKAIETLLVRLEAGGGIEARVASLGLWHAGAEIRRLDSLLRELEARTNDSRRRTRPHAIRQRLEASCRSGFVGALRGELLAPLEALAGNIEPGSQRMLEATARHLRQWETEARRIGGGDVYDTLLREAAEKVAIVADAGGLSPLRTVRLVEILAGPDAAMALLETAPPETINRETVKRETTS